MTNTVDTNRPYMTTPAAAERSGLSKAYITLLLRKGVLEGFQLSRDWLVYSDSLEHFLETPRKSGPKGPRAQAKQASPSTSPARAKQAPSS